MVLDTIKLEVQFHFYYINKNSAVVQVEGLSLTDKLNETTESGPHEKLLTRCLPTKSK